jgi:hypothetical protein
VSSNTSRKLAGRPELQDVAFLDDGCATTTTEDGQAHGEPDGTDDHKDHADRVDVEPFGILNADAQVRIPPKAIRNTDIPMPTMVSLVRCCSLRTYPTRFDLHANSGRVARSVLGTSKECSSLPEIAS